MIGQILQFLSEFWKQLMPGEVLDSEWVGFMRRLGVPVRKMHPGWNWKWPVLETASQVDARAYSYMLDPQSLITKDGKEMVLRLMVKARVKDAQTYYLSVSDGLNNLQDVAAGELGAAVLDAEAEDVLTGKVLERVTKRVRAQGKRWGMVVESVQFVDASRAVSMRLWQSQFTSAGQD